MEKIIKQLQEEKIKFEEKIDALDLQIEKIDLEKENLDSKISKINQSIANLEGLDSINSIQTIKPIILDEDKISKKALKQMKKQLEKPKRKRRTKAEMQEVREVVENYKGVAKKVHFNDKGKYFCNFRNSEDVKKNLLTSDWEKVTCGRCKLKRGEVKEILKKREKKVKEKKQTVWTEEVIQYLRENIHNFNNRELVKELSFRYNISTTIENLQNILRLNGIKRDYQSDMDPEIEKFILKSKLKEYELRDAIIEKFEKNISMTDIKRVVNKRSPVLKKEEVKDEVKRIKQMREKPEESEDDFADELELE